MKDSLSNGTFYITVLMTVYNGETYLAESIESILTQTFKYFEFLIINDGSTDDTEAIVLSLMEKDNRIKYIALPHQGRCSALNFGLSKSNHEWIALQDCDDISLPNRLERQVHVIRNNPKIRVISSYGYYIGKNSKIILGEIAIGPETEKKYLQMVDNNKSIFLLNPSVVMHKQTVLKAGAYRSSPLEDFDLWCRIGDMRELILTFPEHLILWRRTFASLTSKDVFDHQARMRWIKFNMIERRNAREEITFKEYLAAQQLIPLCQRLNTLRKDYGTFFYKLFGLNSANGFYLKGTFYGVLALITDPKYFVYKIFLQQRLNIISWSKKTLWKNYV